MVTGSAWHVHLLFLSRIYLAALALSLSYGLYDFVIEFLVLFEAGFLLRAWFSAFQSEFRYFPNLLIYQSEAYSHR